MFAQRLYELDRSSTYFPEQLDELLQDDEWVGHLQSLPEGELVELIEYLDSVRFIPMPAESCSFPLQTLDGLDHTGSPFREGLHVLQEICSSRVILPATYEVSGELSFSTTEPVTSSVFNDIYKGSLDKVDVCIKRLRTHEDPAEAKQVFHPHNLLLDRHALTSF